MILREYFALFYIIDFYLFTSYFYLISQKCFHVRSMKDLLVARLKQRALTWLHSRFNAVIECHWFLFSILAHCLLGIYRHCVMFILYSKLPYASIRLISITRSNEKSVIYVHKIDLRRQKAEQIPYIVTSLQPITCFSLWTLYLLQLLKENETLSNFGACVKMQLPLLLSFWIFVQSLN